MASTYPEQEAERMKHRGGIESRPNEILSYDEQGRLLGADGQVKAGSVADFQHPASSTGSKNSPPEENYGGRRNSA